MNVFRHRIDIDRFRELMQSPQSTLSRDVFPLCNFLVGCVLSLKIRLVGGEISIWILYIISKFTNDLMIAVLERKEIIFLLVYCAVDKHKHALLFILTHSFCGLQR